MKTKLLIALFAICGIANAQAPNWQWGKGSKGSNEQQSHSCASDANGNLYVTGYFKNSPIVFDNDTLTNTNGGYADIFLVKYDKNGNVIWAKGAGGMYDDKCNSVATDDSGNVFITGWFQSLTITFGTITLTSTNGGYNNIFIVKYDSTGKTIWAKNVGGVNASNATGNSITTDSNGNVFVTGCFNGTSITFGSTTFINSDPSGYGNDMFIVKYDNSGNELWARSATASAGSAITTDTSGNVYVTGYFYHPSIIFGGDTIFNHGSENIFVVKYSNTGNELWAKGIGGASSDEGLSIATDKKNNAYITGWFYSSPMVFGNTILINTQLSTRDIFLLKYDTFGNEIWAKSVGGYGSSANDDFATGVVTDAVGNIYITGWTVSKFITFGSYTLAQASQPYGNAFLVKYDANSNVLWAKNPGGPAGHESMSVATDDSINVFISGFFASYSIIFGNDTVKNASGGYKVFSAKVSTLPLSISHSNNTCLGNTNGSATVIVGAGLPPYTYLWNTSPIQTTATATNLPPGNYTVTVTDGANVFASAFVTITAGVQTSTSVTNLSCNGGNNGAINLSVSGGSSNFLYSWSNSATTQDVSGLSAGAYTVTVVDVTCADTVKKIAIITQPTALSTTMSITNASSCSTSDGKIISNVSGGTSPYSYLWNNGKTIGTITGLTQGNYTLTVTDANNCANTFTATVNCPNGVANYGLQNNLNIYPNPFSTETTLWADKSFKDATLTVYNLYGQTVKHIDNLSGQTIIFHRDNLPSGLYFIRITQDNKKISVDKLVITDN